MKVIWDGINLLWIFENLYLSTFKGGEHARNVNLISGLEWEDPMHTNNLSDSERRRLCVLLTKIAQTVRLRDVVLMPFFQDYEMVSCSSGRPLFSLIKAAPNMYWIQVAKNEGAVTLNHFSRVLHFMGILLSEDDFLLLVKRYLRNSYTVNYVSFVKHIEQIVRYFDEHRITDYSEVSNKGKIWIFDSSCDLV